MKQTTRKRPFVVSAHDLIANLDDAHTVKVVERDPYTQHGEYSIIAH